MKTYVLETSSNTTFDYQFYPTKEKALKEFWRHLYITTNVRNFKHLKNTNYQIRLSELESPFTIEELEDSDNEEAQKVVEYMPIGEPIYVLDYKWIADSGAFKYLYTAYQSPKAIVDDIADFDNCGVEWYTQEQYEKYIDRTQKIKNHLETSKNLHEYANMLLSLETRMFDDYMEVTR